MGSISKPHAVVIPCPVQGHIKTMLKFAKLLHYKGLHITFVNTEFNHKRLLRSRGPDALDDLPGFHFRTIPDGLPPSDIDATQAIPSLCDAMNKNFLGPLTDLLLKLKNTVSENNPPITCIVADPFAPVAIKAGEEVGLPVVLYATVNACGYMGFKHLYTLREKGFTPIKGNLHTVSILQFFRVPATILSIKLGGLTDEASEKAEGTGSSHLTAKRLTEALELISPKKTKPMAKRKGNRAGRKQIDLLIDFLTEGLH